MVRADAASGDALVVLTVIEFPEWRAEIADVAVAHVKGFRVGMVDCYQEDALDRLRDTLLLAWDGSPLSASGFTSLIPNFLRANLERKAVAFKKTGGVDRVKKDWDALASEFPGRVAVVVVDFRAQMEQGWMKSELQLVKELSRQDQDIYLMERLALKTTRAKLVISLGGFGITAHEIKASSMDEVKWIVFALSRGRKEQLPSLMDWIVSTQCPQVDFVTGRDPSESDAFSIIHASTQYDVPPMVKELDPSDVCCSIDPVLSDSSTGVSQCTSESLDTRAVRGRVKTIEEQLCSTRPCELIGDCQPVDAQDDILESAKGPARDQGSKAAEEGAEKVFDKQLMDTSEDTRDESQKIDDKQSEHEQFVSAMDAYEEKEQQQHIREQQPHEQEEKDEESRPPIVDEIEVAAKFRKQDDDIQSRYRECESATQEMSVPKQRRMAEQDACVRQFDSDAVDPSTLGENEARFGSEPGDNGKEQQQNEQDNDAAKAEERVDARRLKETDDAFDAGSCHSELPRIPDSDVAKLEDRVDAVAPFQGCVAQLATTTGDTPEAAGVVETPLRRLQGPNAVEDEQHRSDDEDDEVIEAIISDEEVGEWQPAEEGASCWEYATARAKDSGLPRPVDVVGSVQFTLAIGCADFSRSRFVPLERPHAELVASKAGPGGRGISGDIASCSIDCWHGYSLGDAVEFRSYAGTDFGFLQSTRGASRTVFLPNGSLVRNVAAVEAARPDQAAPPDVSVQVLASGPLALRHSLGLLALQDLDRDRMEVVVVDDVEQSALGEDVFSGLAQDFVRRCVRYVRLEQRVTAGAKYNLAAAISRGRVMMHWNPCDYFGPSRLRLQSAPILGGQADITMLPVADRLRVSVEHGVTSHVSAATAGHPSTLCFRWALWSACEVTRRYADADECVSLDGIKQDFVKRHGAISQDLAASAVDFVHVEGHGHTSSAKRKGVEDVRPPPAYISSEMADVLVKIRDEAMGTTESSRESARQVERQLGYLSRLWSGKGKRTKRRKNPKGLANDEEDLDAVLASFEREQELLSRSRNDDQENEQDPSEINQDGFVDAKTLANRKKKEKKKRSKDGTADPNAAPAEPTRSSQPADSPAVDGDFEQLPQSVSVNARRPRSVPASLIRHVQAQRELQQSLEEQQLAKEQQRRQMAEETRRTTEEKQRLQSDAQQAQLQAQLRVQQQGRLARKEERRRRRTESCTVRGTSQDPDGSKPCASGEDYISASPRFSRPAPATRLKRRQLRTRSETPPPQHNRSARDEPGPASLPVDDKHSDAEALKKKAAEDRNARKAEEEAAKRVLKQAIDKRARSISARKNAEEEAAKKAASDSAAVLFRASRSDGFDLPQDSAGQPDAVVEQWRIKRLIRALEAARSSGYNSMLSLIVGCKDNINHASKMLTESLSACDTLQLHAHKIQAQAIILSAMQRLKAYRQTPKNGLAVFCGFLPMEDGKEKKVMIDFEPLKPINTNMYRNGKQFFTEDLKEMFDESDKYGFIIIDGSGALYGTLQGTRREVLNKFAVDLPKKHGRGGQSALRFARLRLEKRQNFVRKAAELARQLFISGERPNVMGLIVAGCGEIKLDFARSDVLDPRLEAVLHRPLLDVAYGGESGLYQAIELASEALKGVQLVQEKRLVTRLLEELAKDQGRYCVGVRDTLRGLAMGAVETLILWEGLELRRMTLRNPRTGEEHLRYAEPGDETSEDLSRCPETGAKLDLLESVPFVEWAVESYGSLSAKLELVSDKSKEGNQFCKGLGGIGGLLRYRVDFESFEEPEPTSSEGSSSSSSDDSDEDFF